MSMIALCIMITGCIIVLLMVASGFVRMPEGQDDDQ